MVFDNVCNCSTKLSLCLGSSDDMKINHLQTKKKNVVKTTTTQRFDQYLSLTLGLSTLVDGHEHEHEHEHETASSILSSAVSSFSYNATTVKRERQEVSSLEVFDNTASDPYSSRKKLRLTKEQSLVLEDSFKEQDTLSSKEKQGLANMLNLWPRQVEVWFQNRRARMKLKQTEIDTEMLKKCCESLKEENMRLQKELQDLKARKLDQLPVVATAFNMCPSCQRIGSGVAGENPSNVSFSMGGRRRTHFYNPFANPYAAFASHELN